MAAPKIIPYDVELRSVNPVRSFDRPKAYTNDLNSVEFQFKILDMTSTELTTATAVTLVYMRDGSFFANPSTDVSRVGNVFSYLLKENEGNHAGVAQIQLVVTVDGMELASQLFDFEIINGLETKVAQEVMIYDWTTLTRDARAYIDQFVADELLRDAEFDNSQFDHNVAFGAAQTQRGITFGESEASRTTAFNASEAGRTIIFNDAEEARATGYDADHSRAGTDHTTAVNDHTLAGTDHTTAVNDHTLAGTDHTRAEADHTRADADSATVAGFNGRLAAEETATANNKISTVKGKTFADVDARFEDVEADTTTMGNNGVSNGNFSNGTTGWTPWAGTLSAANNILSLANDGTNQSASVAQNTSLLLTNGNKYYVRVNARVRSSLATKIELLTYGSAPIVTIASIATVNNPAGDIWYTLRGICTPTTQTVNLRVFLQHQYADAATASGKVMELQNALAIDLTAIFGKGNEPTVEQMDAIMAKFPNSWFDGTKNLFRASETLKKQIAIDARTEFEASNLLTNGDISNGATGWSIAGAPTITTANGYAEVTPDVAGAGIYQLVAHIKTNIYYTRLRYIGEGLNIRFRNGAGGTLEYKADLPTTVAFTNYSFTRTVVGDSTVLMFLGLTGLKFTIDDIVHINLTATFGAGKEPTLAEMDRLMARFPNSWFDGVKPIQTIETLYQEKANKVQEAWITPTLTNGWIQKAGFMPIGYMKDELGFVHIRGMVDGTGAVSGSTAFTLPVGYRPLSSTYCIGNGSGVFASVPIATDGTVKITSAQIGWVSLEGITFKV